MIIIKSTKMQTMSEKVILFTAAEKQSKNSNLENNLNYFEDPRESDLIFLVVTLSQPFTVPFFLTSNQPLRGIVMSPSPIVFPANHKPCLHGISAGRPFRAAA